MSYQLPDISGDCSLPSETVPRRGSKGTTASTGEHGITKDTDGSQRIKKRCHSRSSMPRKESTEKTFVLETSSIERQQWANEFRQEFVLQRRQIFQRAPASHQKLWGQIMLCKWDKDPWRPVLVLGPYQVHPDLRDVWMNMFKKTKGDPRQMWHWCYWYGSPNSKALTQQKPSTLLPYEIGASTMAHVALATLQAKFDAGKKLKSVEKQAMKGYACMEEDLRKKPAERIPLKFAEVFESLLDLPDKIDYPLEDGSHEVESGRQSLVSAQKKIAITKEKRTVAKARLGNRVTDGSSHETRIKRCRRATDKLATAKTNDVRPRKRPKYVIEEPTAQSSMEYEQDKSVKAAKKALFTENNTTGEELSRTGTNKLDSEGWSARLNNSDSVYNMSIESQKKAPEVKVKMGSGCAMAEVEGCGEKRQGSKIHLKTKVADWMSVSRCLDMGRKHLGGVTERLSSSGRKGAKFSNSRLSEVVSKGKAKVRRGATAIEHPERKATLSSKCMVPTVEIKEPTQMPGPWTLDKTLEAERIPGRPCKEHDTDPGVEICDFRKFEPAPELFFNKSRLSHPACNPLTKARDCTSSSQTAKASKKNRYPCNATKSENGYIQVKCVAQILERVPESHKKLWGQIMLSRVKTNQLRPVLVLSPLQAPRRLRSIWMRMFETSKGSPKRMLYLCYVYGSPVSEAYIHKKRWELMSYEKAVSIKVHVPEAGLQAKVNAGEKLLRTEKEIMKGFACLEEELKKLPEERILEKFHEGDEESDIGSEVEGDTMKNGNNSPVGTLSLKNIAIANQRPADKAPTPELKNGNSSTVGALFLKNIAKARISNQRPTDRGPTPKLTRLVTPPPLEDSHLTPAVENWDALTCTTNEMVQMKPDENLSQVANASTATTPAKKVIRYSNAGLSCCRAHATEGFSVPQGKRVFARSRKWVAEEMKYGAWEYFDCDEGLNEQVFELRRGGRLVFWPQLVPNIDPIKLEMVSRNEYRQYKVRECGAEPRLHALFSSSPNNAHGYKYGSIQMKSHPLEELEEISGLAARLADHCRLPGEAWNIGVDLLIYRDGKDNINWHADDTQEEDTVLSLTVESPEDPRTICFQPSQLVELQDGDEQLEFFPIAGDCYQMDGRSQVGYVHAVLKEKHDVADKRRMAIIFRNGKQRPVSVDTGYQVESIDAPNRIITYKFGPMAGELIEGNCYSRAHLFACGAHANDRGGVAGSKGAGSPSIVISNISNEHGEVDEYRYVTYYVGRLQRPQALFSSFVHKKPVRVFRSSNGVNGQFFPPKGKHVVYRYDGVYYVICVKSENGEEDIHRDSNRTDARVFFLVRPEPKEDMEILQRNHPSFRPFNSEDPEFFNTMKSEEACSAVDPFDIFQYNEWYPQLWI